MSILKNSTVNKCSIKYYAILSVLLIVLTAVLCKIIVVSLPTASNDPAPITAYADGEGTEGLAYTLNGDNASYSVSAGTATSGAVVIPSTYNGLPVTSIGDFAFDCCSSLTSITIPNNVMSIGWGAFEYCSSLTSITIPDSVWSIGYVAFKYCYKLVEVYNKSSLTIIAGSEDNGYVGYYAKAIYTSEYSSKLTTNADGYQLYTDGEDIILIGYIGYEAELTLPNYITVINQGAFYYCISLASITIPNSVTNIGTSAFSGCYKLVEVYNKSSLTITAGSSSNGCVGYYAKAIYTSEYTSKLTTDADGYQIYTDGEDIIIGYAGNKTELTIPEDITKIYQYAFYNCSSLTSITIGSSVTSIGEYAFYNCSSLTSITIGNSVTSIGSSAFRGCSSLTSITIPDCVTSIGYQAFYNCRSLTSITIGNSVTSIGTYAFSGSSAEINWGDNPSIKTIERHSFSNYRGTSITIPNSVTSIGEGAFSGCSGLTSITLPFVGGSIKSATDTYQYPLGYIFGTSSYTGGTATEQYYYGGSISSTNNDTYYIPTSLKSVTITGGNILYGAFYNCNNLSNIVVLGSITGIGDSAFYNCSSLTSITMPNSVTSIGKYAFQNCSLLTSVTIPNNVTSIGISALEGCSSLTRITLPFVGRSLGTTVNYEKPFGYIFGYDILYTNSTQEENVSCFSSVKEGDTTNYTCYKYKVPSSLKIVNINGNGAMGLDGTADCAPFRRCNGITDIIIGNDITAIPNYCCSYADGLKTIQLGNGVEAIGKYAFYLCTKLENVYLNDGLESIGSSAFAATRALKSIYIPYSVTTMGGSVFADTDYYSHNTYTHIYCERTKENIATLSDWKTSGSLVSGAWNIDYDFTVGYTVTTEYGKGKRVIEFNYDNASEIATINNVYENSTDISLPTCRYEVAGASFVGWIQKGDEEYVIRNKTEFDAALGVAVELYPAWQNDLNGLQYCRIDGEVLIVGYVGTDSSLDIADACTQDINVTTVCTRDFKDNDTLYEITIPATIKNISNTSFENSKVARVNIANLSDWCNITFDGYYANPLSCNADLFLNGMQVVYLSIPNDVESIGSYAFCGCSSIKSIIIPDNVISISFGAFYNCSGIDNLTILNSVTSIGDYAFSGCNGLKKILFMGDVPTMNAPEIPCSVWYPVGNITWDSWTKTEKVPFAKLTAVEGETYFEDDAGIRYECIRDGSGNVTCVAVVGYNSNYYPDADVPCYSVVIPDVALYNKGWYDISTIGEDAFKDFTLLSEIALPNSLESIGKGAFGCAGIKKIVIPDNVRRIEENTFSGCVNLVRVIIGNSVEYVGANAFSGNTYLKYVYFKCDYLDTKDGTAFVEKTAFSDNNASRKITFIYDSNASGWDTITNWCCQKKGGTSGNENLFGFCALDGNTTYDGNYYTLYSVISSDRTVFIDQTYDKGTEGTVGDKGVDYQGILYEITGEATLVNGVSVPGTAKIIGIYDADLFATFAEINISDTVILNLYEYYVTEISESAFANKDNITVVNIGRNIEIIGASAFSGASNLSEVYFAREDNSGVTIGSSMLIGTASGLYVVALDNALFGAGKYLNGFTHYCASFLTATVGEKSEFGGTDEQSIFYTLYSKDNTAIVGEDYRDWDFKSNTNPTNTCRYDGRNNGVVVIPDFVYRNGSFYKVVGFDRFAFYKCQNTYFSNSTEIKKYGLNSITFGKFIGANEGGTECADGTYFGAIFQGEFQAVDNTPAVWDCTFRETSLAEINVNGNTLYQSVDGVLYSSVETTDLLGNITYKPYLALKAPEKKDFSAGLNIPDTVIIINCYAFYNCQKLGTVSFVGLTDIGVMAFALSEISGTVDLTCVQGVIGLGAFRACTKITSVILNKYVTLETDVFRGCTGIESFGTAVLSGQDESMETAMYSAVGGVLFEISNISGTTAVLYQYPAGADAETYSVPSAIIGYTVSEIKSAAFEYAVNLEGLNVGDNVTAIGNEAFKGCLRLRTVDIGSAVTVIGKDGSNNPPLHTVFDDCLSLTTVTVSGDNENYMSDASGVLFSKDITVLYLYPAGLTRVTYTVPMSVTSIGDYAFAKNASIISVILPKNLVSLGNYVFYDCEQLRSAYFKGDAPTSTNDVNFGSYVFNGIDSVKEGDVLHIYYKRTSEGWQYAPWAGAYSATTYAIQEEYNVIQEVPNQITEGTVYVFYVMDTNGNSIGDAKNTTLTVRVADKINGVTYGLSYIGNGAFALSQMPDVSVLSVTVTDSSGVYYSFSNTEFNIAGEIPMSFITLIAIPDVQGVSCEGYDINSQTANINVSADNKGNDGNALHGIVDITVTGYCDPIIGRISAFSLVQNGQIIDTLTYDGEEFGWECGKSVTFRTASNKFIMDVDIVVMMETIYIMTNSDGQQEAVEDNLLYEVLNIEIFEFNMVQVAVENSSIPISIADDVPLLSKLNIDLKFNFNSFFDIKFDEKSIYIGIKIKIGEKEKGCNKYVDTFNEILNNYINDYEKQKNKSKNWQQNQKAEFGLEFAGYIVINYATGSNKVNDIVQGKVEGCFFFKYTIGKTVMVGYIPLRLELEIKASTILEAKIVYDEDNGISFEEAKAKFKIDIIGRIGIGCKVASAGIYGKVVFLIIASVPNFDLFEISLSGEVGLYYKIDFGIFKLSGNIALIEGTWIIYSDEGKESSWDNIYGQLSNSSTVALFNSANYVLIPAEEMNDSFADDRIQVAMINNKKIAVTSANALNLNVDGYDEYNYNKLVYSYTDSDGTWQEFALIDNNGYCDGEYKLVNESGTVYLVYSQANSKSNADDDLGVFSGKTEVKVAVWDNVNNVWTGITRLTNDTVYQGNFAFTTVTGNPAIIYIENSENNPFGVKTTFDNEGNEVFEVTTANSIWCSLLIDGRWQQPQKLIGDLHTVTYIAAGNGNVYFIIDADCDLTTTEDRDIYSLSIAEVVQSGGAVLLSNATHVLDESGEYTSLQYEGGNLYYLDGGKFYVLSSADALTTFDGEYSFVYDGSSNIRGVVYYEYSNNTTKVYYIEYNRDFDVWGLPVLIKEENGEVCYAPYVSDNSLMLLKVSNGAIGNCTIELLPDIAASVDDDGNTVCDIGYEDMSYDNDTNTISTELTVKVENNGLSTVFSARFDVYSPDGTTIYFETRNINLASGCSEELTIQLNGIPFVKGEYTLLMTVDGEIEKSNNVFTFVLAYTDLNISAKHIVNGGENYILVKIANSGFLTSEYSTLYIAKGVEECKNFDELKDSIDRYDLEVDTIAYNGFRLYLIELGEEFFENEMTSGIITVYVDAWSNNMDDDEYYSMNNYAYLSIDEIIKDMAVKTEDLKTSPYLSVQSIRTDRSTTTAKTISYYENGNNFVGVFLGDNLLNESDVVVDKNNCTVEFQKAYLYGLEAGRSLLTFRFENAQTIIDKYLVVYSTVPKNNVLCYVSDNNSEKLVYQNKVEFGETLASAVIAAPTKDGYRFVSWQMLDGDTLVNVPATMPANSISLYAQYEINEYAVKYYIDGRLVYTDTFEYGATVTARDNETKVGYTFSGWSEIPATIGAEDVSVIGTFTINSYNVKYYIDGVLTYTDTFEYGATVTARDNETKVGYTFSGWSEIPATIGAENVTVIGTFTINSYNVKYYIDGVLTYTDTFEYGATVTARDNETKVGYTFSGWSEIPSTIGAEDVTVIGTFTIVDDGGESGGGGTDAPINEQAKALLEEIKGGGLNAQLFGEFCELFEKTKDLSYNEIHADQDLEEFVAYCDGYNASVKNINSDLKNAEKHSNDMANALSLMSFVSAGLYISKLRLVK